MVPINHLNRQLPKYATITGWCDLTQMGRTSTYKAIGAGHLKAIKVEGRTLIDVDHGLAWLKSLPAPKISVGRQAVAA